MDLVDVFPRDRGRRVVDRVLERGLATPLLGAQLGELAAHGHEITRASQRVPADVFEDVLAFASMVVGNDVGTEERGEWVALQPPRVHEISRRLAADVVDEDLSQARG